MASFTQDLASWVEVSVHAFLWLMDGSSSSSLFDVLPLYCQLHQEAVREMTTCCTQQLLRSVVSARQTFSAGLRGFILDVICSH